MANRKTKVSRGGKKVKTVRNTKNSYSKSKRLKTNSKSKKSFYSSESNRAGTKDKEVRTSSKRINKPKRKVSSESSYISKSYNKKNASGYSTVGRVSKTKKTPRVIKSKSSISGLKRNTNYDNNEYIIGGSSAGVSKDKSYKKTKRGKVKAKGLLNRGVSASGKYTGTISSYKYKKSPSGKTKLKQKTRKSTPSKISKVKKVYKNGVLKRTRTRTKKRK